MAGPRFDRALVQNLLDSVDGAHTRYQVAPDGFLGRGGYGFVIKAFDWIRETDVAAKYVPVIEDATLARRLLREIKLMQHLCTKGHPYLVTLYDVSYSSFDNFEAMVFIMECAETSLDKLFKNSEVVLSISQIQLLMAQLLYGVEFLHKSQVIHRDLKPANILIHFNEHQEQEGQRQLTWTAKICDLGLGRSLNTSMLSSYVMTMYWRAPEVLLSCKEYSEAVDIWSLGCILAQMFNRSLHPETGLGVHRPLFVGAVNGYQMIDHIMAFVGRVSESTILKLGNRFTQEHLRQFPAREPVNLSERLICPDLVTPIPSEAVDLIWMMLTLDPDERIPAPDARTHPFIHPALQWVDTERLDGFTHSAEPFVDDFDTPLNTAVSSNNDMNEIITRVTGEANWQDG